MAKPKQPKTFEGTGLSVATACEMISNTNSKQLFLLQQAETVAQFLADESIPPENLRRLAKPLNEAVEQARLAMGLTD